MSGQNYFARARSAAAVDWNKADILNEPLYDTQKYVAAGQTKLEFYQVPVGNGTSVYGTGTKTYEDTNMEAVGALERGNGFVAYGLCLRFTSGQGPVLDDVTTAAPAAEIKIAANDEQVFWRQGWLELVIQGTTKLRMAPLCNFPAPTRLQMHGFGGVAYTQATAADGAVQMIGSHMEPVGNIYQFPGDGLSLPYGLKFSFTLNWSQAVALPSGLDGIVQMSLIGEKARAVA